MSTLESDRINAPKTARGLALRSAILKSQESRLLILYCSLDLVIFEFGWYPRY